VGAERGLATAPKAWDTMPRGSLLGRQQLRGPRETGREAAAGPGGELGSATP